MVNLRIEDKPAFCVLGQKTWISGQDNAQFAAFWSNAHQNGLIRRLQTLAGGAPGPVTGGSVMGISCVDADPENRAFDFYIAAEAPRGVMSCGLEGREIPACRWAIFHNRGDAARALIEAEMYAFITWLPASGFKHAHAPELEVYPHGDGQDVEFWLPVALL